MLGYNYTVYSLHARCAFSLSTRERERHINVVLRHGFMRATLRCRPTGQGFFPHTPSKQARERERVLKRPRKRLRAQRGGGGGCTHEYLPPKPQASKQERARVCMGLAPPQHWRQEKVHTHSLTQRVVRRADGLKVACLHMCIYIYIHVDR